MNSKYTSCVKAAYNKYGKTFNAKYNYPEDSYTFFELGYGYIPTVRMLLGLLNCFRLPPQIYKSILKIR